MEQNFTVFFTGTESPLSGHPAASDARAAAETYLMELFGSPSLFRGVADSPLHWSWESNGNMCFRAGDTWHLSPIQMNPPLKDNPQYGREEDYPWKGEYVMYDRYTRSVLHDSLWGSQEAKEICARDERLLIADSEPGVEFEWRRNRLFLVTHDGGPKLLRLARYQIRPLLKDGQDSSSAPQAQSPEPQQEQVQPIAEAEPEAQESPGGAAKSAYMFEATFCGKRYLFDPFGPAIEAALFGAISECNNITEFWKGIADRNFKGEFPDETERRTSREMALLVGGKMQGYQEVLDKVLFALGKRPQ